MTAACSSPIVSRFATTTDETRCDRFVSPPGSISQSLASANSGDVVCVRGGEYREKVTMTRSGVTAINAPGEVPVVDGFGLAIGTGDALWTIAAGVNDATVQGFTIRNSSGRGLSNDGSRNRVVGNRITDTSNAGLLTTNWSGPATGNQYMFNEIARTVQGNQCRTVSDPCRAAGGWDAAINQYDDGPYPAGGNTYVGNLVHDNNGEGATVMDHDRFVANTMHDNYSINLYLDSAQEVTAEDNFLYESETSYLPVGMNGNESYRLLASGILQADEVTARSSGNVVRHNLIVNTRDGIAFWRAAAGSGLKNDLIERNTVVNTWDNGLAFDSGEHSNTVLRDNIVVPRQNRVTRGLPAVGITESGNLLTTQGAPHDPHLPGEGTFSLNPQDYAR
jgi:hypothetical protein